MLGAFHAEPTMRPSILPVVCLMPAWTGAASAAPAPGTTFTACVVVDPFLVADPPAWLLLAAAALLLGAGRLAAS
jgi:hypothetical protein